jgi:hypothetical protein
MTDSGALVMLGWQCDLYGLSAFSNDVLSMVLSVVEK